MQPIGTAVPVTQQPFDNQQPALGVSEVMTLSGIFRSGGGGGSATGDTLGFVYNFAGSFQPGDSLFLQGQLPSTTADPVLFDLLGTTYGGDGTTTFALPNLQGTTTRWCTTSGDVANWCRGPMSRLVDWIGLVRAPAALHLGVSHFLLSEIFPEKADDPKRPRAYNAVLQSEYARLAGLSQAALTAAMEDYTNGPID